MPDIAGEPSELWVQSIYDTLKETNLDDLLKGFDDPEAVMRVHVEVDDIDDKGMKAMRVLAIVAHPWARKLEPQAFLAKFPDILMECDLVLGATACA